MHTQIPPDEYYKKIAKVPTSGGAIFRNSSGEFLIVKQSYKDEWHIPGGVTEENESPREAVIREVREELGIDIADARPFCIDFARSAPFPRILFVFNCGILNDDTIKKIKIDNDETVDFKFVPYEEMMTLLAKKKIVRMKNSIEAFRNGTCVYLEDGKPLL